MKSYKVNNNVPQISVILPTYNRSSIIKNAINSVITQSFTDWELLIIDDCSQDDTASIIEPYLLSYPAIFYYKNEMNLGLPRSRNKGIKIAKGKYVFFIEDDLVLDKNCLSNLFDAVTNSFEKEKIGGVCPRLIEKNVPVIHPNKPFITNKMTGEIDLNYTIKLPDVVKIESAHACTLYKRNLLLKIKGYRENRYKGNYAYEDVDLNRRILNMGCLLLFQPKAVAYHNKIETGGCRVTSNTREKYYYYRNYVIFILSNYGFSAPFMVAGKCFLDLKKLGEYILFYR
ncbi:MAG: glycosyltransferase family 2 protein [Methanospirillaceae archaeon]|nr:glycosyltransferase family 2 protein [Methanospirillaceae archaeon]